MTPTHDVGDVYVVTRDVGVTVSLVGTSDERELVVGLQVGVVGVVSLSFAKLSVIPSSHKWVSQSPSSIRTLDSEAR